MSDKITTTTIQETGIKAMFARDDVKQKFAEILGKRAASFMTSVLQIVASNKLLANADAASIYHSAAVAATLDLPLNNNLGFAYIVPYNAKQPDGSFKQVAQFQMGYKGFIQLAQRSGQVKKIYAAPIKQGQLVSSNPLTGYVFDFENKESDQVIGYAARVELLNGFEAVLYMSVEELKQHGKKFSQTFKKGSGLWADNFESMATKTVLKLLISKYVPLSVDMQTAVTVDQAIIKSADGSEIEYADHEDVTIDKESERMRLMISNATTIGELRKLVKDMPDSLQDDWNAKYSELENAK